MKKRGMWEAAVFVTVCLLLAVAESGRIPKKDVRGRRLLPEQRIEWRI